MKNKRGFTLIEMLVVVALIAALSVSMGISANNVAKNTRISQYQDTMYNIFNAASISLSMHSMGGDCPNKYDWESLNKEGSLNITLECLVNKGLLDEKIYETNNPMYVEHTFLKADKINVHKTSDGEKKISISCGSNILTFDNLYEYEKWGECE